MIRTPQPPQLNLARNAYELPLFVDMEAFFDFTFWLSEELLDLESQFQQRHSGRIAPKKKARSVEQAL